MERSEEMGWYQGPTLLEALEAIPLPKRPLNRSLRISISDVYKIGGIGTVPVGLVHSGQIQVGMVVNFAPSTATAEVKSIEINHKSVSSALAGDFIGFNVRDVPVEHIRRGYVASDPKNDPAKDTSVFQAEVRILNHPG